MFQFIYTTWLFLLNSNSACFNHVSGTYNLARLAWPRGEFIVNVDIWLKCFHRISYQTSPLYFAIWWMCSHRTSLCTNGAITFLNNYMFLFSSDACFKNKLVKSCQILFKSIKLSNVIWSYKVAKSYLKLSVQNKLMKIVFFFESIMLPNSLWKLQTFSWKLKLTYELCTFI